MALKRTYTYLYTVYIIYVVIYQVKYVQTSPAMKILCSNIFNIFTVFALIFFTYLPESQI